MKMNAKIGRRISGLLVCLLFCGWLAVVCGAEESTALTVATDTVDSVTATADKKAEPVSPALCNLAAQTEMAVATVKGSEYYFSGDVFARFLNVSAVHYITVESLPDATAGELMMGGTGVRAGDTVSVSDLRKLSFAAADNTAPCHTSFTFSAGGGGYAMTCHLWTLDDYNRSPTVGDAVETALYTHRNFLGYGTLQATDPEGDTLTFEVVGHPEHGIVVLTDRHAGNYVYLPLLGYSGEDSFSYVAYDSYGNYSAAAEVSVTVSVPSLSLTYADMENRQEYNAALTMAEAGIMTGSEQDGKLCFCPDESVSRVDFLTMAMQCAGITSVPETADTGFSDNGDIPEHQRGYVAAAWSLGLIRGTADSAGNLSFLPNEAISRTEATALLRALSGVSDSAARAVFADAAEADGEALALTRGDAALLLETLYRMKVNNTD